uniref:Uncharacterized protein n=1 Tax=Zea mays TaxID=4577 RepID=C4J1N3_MAIZE|nr:unknown [Zea mays]
MATRRSRALERTEGKLYPARSKTNQTVVAPTTAAAEAFLRRHSSKSATGPGPRARKGMSSQGSAGFSGRAVLTIRCCRSEVERERETERGGHGRAYLHRRRGGRGETAVRWPCEIAWGLG